MNRWLRIGLVAAICAALPPILGRAAPGLLTDTRSLVLGSGICFAVAALALNMVMGYAGQVSLGHFALVGVGAFTSGVLTGPTRVGLPFAVALPAAVAVGAAVALVIGLPALRLRGMYLAIATIGFSYAMEKSVFRTSAITGGSAGIELPRPIAGSFVFDRNADYLALLAVLLVGIWLIDTNVTRTRLGRAFRAIRENEDVAASFGVHVAAYKLLAFAISGGIAGAAGSMYGHLYGFVNAETFTYDVSLLLVVLVVVGGLGSRVGAVIAGIAFEVLGELLPELLGQDMLGWDLVIGALLLMFTVARHPGGIAQALRESAERKEVRAARELGEDDVTLPPLPNLPRPSGLPARAAVAADTPLLVVRDVSVRFGGLRAVDGASFAVPRGGVVGLIGPNGAGKTTLFNVVSGLVRPQRGSVELLGRDITQLAPHERAAAGIGRTFQLIGLAKDLSVMENLLLAQHTVAGYTIPEALVHTGRTPRVERELRERARAAVSALGFERYRDTPVRLLSHGQQRIVEIGCALVTAPELVMLDEPSAGMSPGAAENLAVRLRDLRDELGRTVLIIEHNIPLVLDVCDELVVLAAGQVIAAGPTREIARAPQVVAAYFGDAVLV